MDISGNITHILPPTGGTSKTGSAWRKQEYVLETKDQYPKKICFNAWGDKIDQFDLQIGDEVVVSADVESREYQGKWYTEVKAWKVVKGAAGSAGSTPPPPAADYMPPPPEPDTDDLPF